VLSSKHNRTVSCRLAARVPTRIKWVLDQYEHFDTIQGARCDGTYKMPECDFVDLVDTRTLCAGRMARRPRRAARSFLRSCQAKAKGHADMRLACGSAVVGGGVDASHTAFGSPRPGRGPPKTGFEPGVDGASPLRNSVRRRACKPAARPAIPGAILLHYASLFGMSGVRAQCAAATKSAS
jgi:hypothetical protein